MVGRRDMGSLKGAGSPASMPEGTPSLASPTDHSWTLQAVMDMQRSVGVLCEKVDRLSSDINSLDGRIEVFGDKLDKVRHWQSVVTGGAVVVGAIATIVWSIVTFVPWGRVHIDAAPQISMSKAK